MKKFILSTLLICLSGFAFAQTDSTTENKIKRLVIATGTSVESSKFLIPLVNELKKKAPEVPNEFWDEFIKEVKTENLESLVASIYAKHFTANEIDELLKFYDTDLGRKMMRLSSVIKEEAAEVGKEWGIKVVHQAVKKLQEKGFIQ